jgi:single-strand DNA-binding protein
MGAVNKVILVGNVGSEPELRYTPAGTAWATFRLATNDAWTDKGGQRQERTEWHGVIAWGKLADLCKQFLGRGRPVYVEGRLHTREWTDRENRKRSSTEIVAEEVVFLRAGRRDEGGAEPPRPEPPEAVEPPELLDS